MYLHLSGLAYIYLSLFSCDSLSLVDSFFSQSWKGHLGLWMLYVSLPKNPSWRYPSY